jgi:peptide/nickel transport system substrate-binding protein
VRSQISTRRWYRLLALLLGLAMVAAACGDDDESGSEEPDGEDSVDAAPDEPEGEPQPGGSVVYGLEAETNGGYCLPEAQLAISGIQVAVTLYDTLAAPDSDGEMQPYLAESIEPNEDYTQWTIKVREGIKFHDGTDLTGEVVKNNLDAYRGAYEGRNPALFLFVFEDIESVELTDPMTVTVTTSRPWTAFDWFLWGSGRVGMVAQAQLDDAENCGTNLIGTGPFELERWTQGQELVATKFADYWRTDEAGNQLPYLDQITYRPIPEVAARMNALESGQIDIAHTSDTEQVAQRLQPLAEAEQIDLLSTDAWSEVNYLMLNVSQPPFDNKNARLAAAHALDKQLLIDVRGGGLGSPAGGPFGEDVPGYVEDPGFPEYDPVAAEEAAAAYEEETGQPLSFTYSFVATESGQLTAQELQTQFSAVGIEVDLDPTGDQATAINEALAGDFQALGWRNHPGADPDTQYNWWYEGSPVNFGRIADPEINRLLDEGRTTPPGEERVEIYEDLNRRFAEEVWNLWMTTTVWTVASQPEVNNLLGYGPPEGSGPFPGLGTGHHVSGIWLGQ